MNLAQCSTSNTPNPCHHIATTTAPLTCCRARHYPAAVCSTSRGLSGRIWRGTSGTCSRQHSSAPSSSPIGAGFFFVAKKDKTLRPCIDFNGLNDITVKNKYSLPLIFSAFVPLQGATIFYRQKLLHNNRETVNLWLFLRPQSYFNIYNCCIPTER